MNNNWITLANATTTHALKGGVVLQLENSEESILRKGLEVRLTLKDKIIDTCICNIQFGNKVIVYFENISTIELAQEILPFSLSVNRKDFPVLKEGEYYLVDLLGFEVFILSDHFNLGNVIGFYSNGAQDIVRIKNKQNEMTEIPFLKPILERVDLETKSIWLNWYR